MPRTAIKHEFELKTRNDYTKVDCEITVAVNGKELPNLATLGKALEACSLLVQTQVTESFQLVPERV